MLNNDMFTIGRFWSFWSKKNKSSFPFMVDLLQSAGASLLGLAKSISYSEFNYHTTSIMRSFFFRRGAHDQESTIKKIC